MISIVIICERREDRKKIFELLSSCRDFKIVLVGCSGYDAIMAAERFRPDIFIMDLWLSNTDALQFAATIKRKSPSSALMVLSSRDNNEYAVRAIRAGISGFLLKQTDMDILVYSVRIVFSGGYYVSAPILKRIFSADYQFPGLFGDAMSRRTDEKCVAAELSLMERRIIIGIAQGYSDREIARNLYIQPGTVRNYMSSAKRKTGLKNRVQVVIQAIRYGMIYLPLGEKETAAEPPCRLTCRQ
jgi:DNA-binding NarL/FixJ family response regulator